MRTENCKGPHLVYCNSTPSKERERWPKELSLLRLSMHAVGVRMLRLEYDGCEGEGDFLVPRLLDNELRGIDANLKKEFVVQLEMFFGALLTTRYGDWSADMGACGDFCIDFKLGTVVHVHRYRYSVIQYDTRRHEGFRDSQDQ